MQDVFLHMYFFLQLFSERKSREKEIWSDLGFFPLYNQPDFLPAPSPIKGGVHGDGLKYVDKQMDR